jgi:demethylmenaquinone methyltransferase/2-methoxy-6-polyprenyl-1,4-benzoquinol methylase
MARSPYSSTTARLYDSIIEPLNRKLRGMGLRMCAPQPGLAVLDVGCGTGTFLELFGEGGCEITGIDLSENMLEQARRRLGDTATLVHGDATDMPFPDGAFDVVTFFLMIHEVEPATRRELLREALRVLRVDGRILIVDYHPGPIRGRRGRLIRLFHLLPEQLAGREHYGNYRNFLARGGTPALADELALRIEEQRVVALGNMALCVLSSPE